MRTRLSIWVKCRRLLQVAPIALLFPFLSVESDVQAEPPVGAKLTPLDAYVAKKDDSYSWSVKETIASGPLTTHVIRLNSQTWRTKDEVDRPLWEHWLVVTVPQKPAILTSFGSPERTC